MAHATSEIGPNQLVITVPNAVAANETTPITVARPHKIAINHPIATTTNPIVAESALFSQINFVSGEIIHKNTSTTFLIIGKIDSPRDTFNS